MKTITETSELFDWFADRLLNQEPQGQVPEGVVKLFKSFVTALKEEGFSDGVMLRENLIRVLGNSRKMVRGSLQLAEFLASCDGLTFYGAEFGHDDAVPEFFNFAAQHLGIDDLEMTDDEDGVVRSSRAFEQREKVAFHVTGLNSYIDRVLFNDHGLRSDRGHHARSR